MNSARARRLVGKEFTPKSRAAYVRTEPDTLTLKRFGFTPSCVATTLTPFTPLVKPFLLASFRAALTAPATFKELGQVLGEVALLHLVVIGRVRERQRQNPLLLQVRLVDAGEARRGRTRYCVALSVITVESPMLIVASPGKMKRSGVRAR